MKYFILTMTALIIISQSIPMVKRFQAGQVFCFSDDVPQHTLVRLKTKVQGPIQLQIYSSHTITRNKQLVGQQVQQWTSQRYGIYKYCFKNYQNTIGYLRYDYDVGQRAKDFSSSYDGQDYIRSLQNQAKIATQFIQDIERQNTEGMQIMISQNLQTSGYSCVYALSTFFVIVSIALVFTQFKMVKKHLHNRKYL